MNHSEPDQPTFSRPLPYRGNSADYFRAVRAMPWPIWLDSGQPHQNRGRYDIISAAPARKLISDASGNRCIEQEKIRQYQDPWAALEQELAPPTGSLANATPLPFYSGALGYLGYDIGRQLEHLPNRIGDDSELPLMLVGIYRWAIIQDHQLQAAHLAHAADMPEAEVETLLLRLQNAGHEDCPATAAQVEVSPFKAGAFKSNLTEKDYLEKIRRIGQYIAAGDCYQVNFSQRFAADYQGDPLQAYLTLRESLPSPFSAYFETEYGTILSLSPEQFLHSDGHQVTTKPIKGTCPRGTTASEDRQLAEALVQSPKNRAENLMIVDLLRNDLSKVCHTVNTTRLFELESYANVHHLVSTVTGQLRDNVSAVELLKACFPGGSITGAPKVRAMEIIEELEASRRTVYCGSVVYIDQSGKMDSNIAIRTLALNKDKIFTWGGGGIVFDSLPEEEYQESLTKIGLILDTLAGL
ncbi:MAG: aminodeoxychorismate synthase component I [Gammaproteobacteria bacterium]|nr:aminodeoxychorismate synthase component I [Gammaproteobacteria bacterium]